MKKLPSRWITIFLTTGVLWFALTPPAFADSIYDLLQQIRNATQATAKYVNSILVDLESTGKQVLDAMTAPTPKIDEVTKANTQIGSSLTEAQTNYELPLTTDAINAVLTNTADNAASSPQTKLVGLSGPDFPIYRNFKIAPNREITLPDMSAQGPSPFNSDTLLGKVAFPDGAGDGGSDCQSSANQSGNKPLCQSYAAQSFIGYLSGLGSPPIVPAFSSMKAKGFTETQIKDFRNSSGVQDYLAALRSYVAQQSAGMSQLNYLYAQRVIQKDLGKRLNVHKYGTVDAKGKVTPGEVIADVSPLQAEEYLATRRVSDPGWYKEMESATSPMVLARETLYILAEIRLELFKTRMENQRLLATLAALQLQGVKSQKILIDQQASTIKWPTPPQPDEG
jgi:hypothetical protein